MGEKINGNSAYFKRFVVGNEVAQRLEHNHHLINY